MLIHNLKTCSRVFARSHSFRNILTTMDEAGESAEKEDAILISKENNTNVDIPRVIKEGSAEIQVRPGSKVFYNPVQEFNRDLSIAALEVFSREMQNGPKVEKAGNEYRGLRILEALAATGLRSLRYAKEISNVHEVVANDLSAVAVENIKQNIEHNGVADIVKTSHKDAVEVMFENRHWMKRFHVVDLDPYGCASPFLDAAVQSVSDGGVLLVTCTDMAVLCGNTANTCYCKYGAVSLKHKSCHEMALRIVLQCIEAQANKYKRYIKPLISISADFYVRVIVKMFTGAAACKHTTSKLSMVYQCTGCESLTLQPLGVVGENKNHNMVYTLPPAPAVTTLCSHCGSKQQMGGPMWSAPIHDADFVTQLLNVVEEKDMGTQKRLLGVLSMVREELLDVPLFYAADRMCAILRSGCIPMMMLRSALLNAGYRVSYSHANQKSVKTDAPVSVLWDILRAWAHQDPSTASKVEGLPERCPARTILCKESTTVADFSLRPDANPVSRTLKLVRFQDNPPFWGPGTRSTTNTTNLSEPPKRKRNQSKKRKRHCKTDESSEDNNGKKFLKTVDEVSNGAAT